MRTLFIIIILFCIGCSRFEKKRISFWEEQKEKFRYQNKNEFVVDDKLRAEYKTFSKMSHPMFDSIISSNDVYLYSWQERDNTKTEFSVVKDDGEHGIKIIYFILDKGRLCSWVQVAGQGGEGGYLFEARSIFKNRDTLIRLGATTQVIDLEKAKPLEKPIGDTSFFYLVIDRRGQVQEKLFKEVKELHFDEQMQ